MYNDNLTTKITIDYLLEHVRKVQTKLLIPEVGRFFTFLKNLAAQKEVLALYQVNIFTFIGFCMWTECQTVADVVECATAEVSSFDLGEIS